MISPAHLRIFTTKAIIIAALLINVMPAANAQEASIQQSITTSPGEEINFELFKSADKDVQLRVLWIAPSFGISPRHQETAQALAELGVEVWLIDLVDALFLTKGATSIRKVPGSLVADILNVLSNYNNDPAEVLIVSSSYGAIPSLRGIHAWQSQKTKTKGLLGAVFFSPSFFSHVPELGLEPDFIPELAASNAPIYIFQSANNGNRWHLPTVLRNLEHAVTYVELLKDTISIFYRKDMSPGTLKNFKNAPKMILGAAKQLRPHDMPLTPLPLSLNTNTTNTSGINTQLKPYRGLIHPTPIHLKNASGQQFDITDYQGKVTVINFWASWCPPCVEEIPSLNNLKEAMQGKPFQLISINYAEDAEKIRDFLKLVNVDFPVLLDPGGELTGQWKVMAFPSTFVIGPDGKIHYGVNAGIHWDANEVIQKINDLLPTPSSLK